MWKRLGTEEKKTAAAERERTRKRTSGSSFIDYTRPVLGPCLQESFAMFVALVRASQYGYNASHQLSGIKNEEREREKKKEMAFRMQTAGREQLGKRRVVMELILGRILLRSSNMKHNETSKHFASVYGRSFHSRCKNICEFL